MKVFFKYKVMVVHELGGELVKCLACTIADNKDIVEKEVKNLCVPICMKISVMKLDTVKMWYNNLKQMFYERCY